MSRTPSTAPMGIHQTLRNDEDTIRLLLLQPSTDSKADIEFTLKHTSLSARETKYEALSYTWGEPHPTRQIFRLISGSRESVDIRENLHDCLLRIRCPQRVRKLWIDALCINQADLIEKALQIKLMPRIYGTADRVLAWLGNSADGSDKFLGYANSPQPTSFLELVQVKDAFFRRPYWNRTWVIQEQLKAKDVLFLCGTAVSERSKLQDLLSAIKKAGIMTQRDGTALALVSGQYKSEPGRSADGSLAMLLVAHCTSECANELDRVYALLGIMHKDASASSLPIEYSTTTAQLFLRVLNIIDIFVQPTDNLGIEALRSALNLNWSIIFPAMHASRMQPDAPGHHTGSCYVARRGKLDASEHNVYEIKSLLRDHPDIFIDNTGYCGFRTSTALNSQAWDTRVAVEVGDLCFVFPDSQYAVLFRAEKAILSCIGGAWNKLPRGSRDDSDLTVDLSTLHRYLQRCSNFAGVSLETDTEERNLFHASRWLLAVIEAYTALRQNYDDFSSDSGVWLNKTQRFPWKNLRKTSVGRAVHHRRRQPHEDN